LPSVAAKSVLTGLAPRARSLNLLTSAPRISFARKSGVASGISSETPPVKRRVAGSAVAYQAQSKGTSVWMRCNVSTRGDDVGPQRLDVLGLEDISKAGYSV
jgi:hypothetical protein